MPRRLLRLELGGATVCLLGGFPLAETLENSASREPRIPLPRIQLDRAIHITDRPLGLTGLAEHVGGVEERSQTGCIDP